ncbi:FMRFamide receptor [Mizuhopecten yessoensis]|uniref:FMRFamide receptor n=1 Tax=Mizuhopecten yessoensis TaxID=6573 RepID=A0A210PDK8_MIZYE|nr:FMRFamide receptor [Mizuhopecten yessoensis]
MMGLNTNVSQLRNISESIFEEIKNKSDKYSPSSPIVPTFTLVAYGILIPVAVGVGYVGNILTAIVLWSKEMASTTNLFLRALVLSDIALITSALLLTPGLVISSGDPETNELWPQGLSTLKFLMMTSQLCNVYILVFVSVERFFAICLPFKHLYLHTRRNVLLSIFINVLFSVLFNIPRLFVLDVRQAQCTGVNSTRPCFIYEWTVFGESSFYQDVYALWMYVLVYFAIPLTVLLTLNILIVKELKRMEIRLVRIGAENNNVTSEKVNITKTIVLICAVFTLVQTLGFISQLEYWILNREGRVLLVIVNFLYVVNSSINFAIYIVIGKKFRKKVLSVFAKCQCRFSE